MFDFSTQKTVSSQTLFFPCFEVKFSEPIVVLLGERYLEVVMLKDVEVWVKCSDSPLPFVRLVLFPW